MTEIEQLKKCRDPEAAKRLLLAFVERKLAEGSDVEDALQGIADALRSGRMVFRKRRHPTPGGHPYLVAEFREVRP
jgi:hypothetical protein